MTRLTQRELERHLCDAATLLRGLADASDCKQHIVPLLFLKPLSDVRDQDYPQALDDTGSGTKPAGADVLTRQPSIRRATASMTKAT